MGLQFSKLFSSLIGKEERRVLMVGLDKAGKTTILNRIHPSQMMFNVPIMGLNVELVESGNISFRALDIGDQDKIRPLLRQDFPNTQGIIYVVDSNDRGRISEAREELQKLLNEDKLRDAILLVFANKQDSPNAIDAAEVTNELGLRSLQRPWYIQPTCATSGDGLYEGLDWLAETLKKRND